MSNIKSAGGITTPSKSAALKWNRVPQSIPPGKEDGFFSPEVWLALSDGSVYMGKCLHKSPGHTYDGPVHSWFAQKDGQSMHLDCDAFNGAHVVAWMPPATPDHPDLVGYDEPAIEHTAI